ncbi:thioredoxin family protein [Artemisia annua]|uniref:Thioredoxin family protein n=1 Tax=Artemisia annua TaxID=35608 RepID=A0A2U1QI18_ARTAN|nr:thioredoxin family protein [Artemisia annua]
MKSQICPVFQEPKNEYALLFSVVFKLNQKYSIVVADVAPMIAHGPATAINIMGEVASVPMERYSVSLVPKSEYPSGQYGLGVGGYIAKETAKLGPRPEKPIEIYEFEGCPFCRKVREIVAVLDLDVLYYPCPRNGPNFRPKVVQMGGKQMFPYMVDPNTGVSMYESDDIIKYLVQKYG